MKINLNDLMTLIRSGKEEFSLEDIESLTGKELEKKDRLLERDEIRVSKVFGDVSSDDLFGESTKSKNEHDDLFSEPKAGLKCAEPAPKEGLFSSPHLDNCYNRYFAEKGYSGEPDYSEGSGTSRLGVSKEESKAILDEVFGSDVSDYMFNDSDKKKPVSPIDVSDFNDKVDYVRSNIGDKGMNNLEYSLNLINYYEENKHNPAFQKRIEFVKKLKASPEVLQIKREVALVKTLIGFNVSKQTLSTKARLFCLRDYVNDYRLNAYAEKAEKIMDRFTERMGMSEYNSRIAKVIELLNHYNVPKNLQLFAILRTKDFNCLSKSMIDLGVGLYSLLETYGLDGLLSENILESLIVGDDVAFVEDYVKCRSLTNDCNAVRKFVMEYLDGFGFRNEDHISCLLNRVGVEHTFIDSKLVDAEKVFDVVTERASDLNINFRDLYRKYFEKLLEHSNLVKLDNELNGIVFNAFERL